MFENVIVSLIVSIALMHIAWRWMPKKLKRICADIATRLAIKINMSNLANWFNRKNVQTSGCNSCSSCGTCNSKEDQKNYAKKFVQINSKNVKVN